MLMESCTGVRRNAANKELVFQCRVDGKDTELTIPVEILAKFAWATWAEHATPPGIRRVSVAVPVESLGTAASEDEFILQLNLHGGWIVPLSLKRDHVKPMQQIAQQLELFYMAASKA